MQRALARLDCGPSLGMWRGIPVLPFQRIVERLHAYFRLGAIIVLPSVNWSSDAQRSRKRSGQSEKRRDLLLSLRAWDLVYPWCAIEQVGSAPTQRA
jgi:hypothetical protein